MNQFTQIILNIEPFLVGVNITRFVCVINPPGATSQLSINDADYYAESITDCVQQFVLARSLEEAA